AQVAKNLFWGRCGCSARVADLLVAALAAHFGRGVQKDFDFGVREDDGADVTAFHDHTTTRADLLLQANHPDSHRWEDADARCSFSDQRVANEPGNVLAIEQDKILFITGLEADF